MHVLYWIIAVVVLILILRYIAFPPIAARITTSKWLSRVAMPGLKDSGQVAVPAPQIDEEEPYVTLPNGSTVPLSVARRLFPTFVGNTNETP